MPDSAIFVSFNIANMFPSSDFDSRTNLSPFTECIIEALEICLTNNNSTFAGQCFTQTNETTMVQLIFVLTMTWQFNQQIMM